MNFSTKQFANTWQTSTNLFSLQINEFHLLLSRWWV